jgi:hypothetical protein
MRLADILRIASLALIVAGTYEFFTLAEFVPAPSGLSCLITMTGCPAGSVISQQPYSGKVTTDITHFIRQQNKIVDL